MLSRDKFIDTTDLINDESFVAWCWESIATRYALQAILVARCDEAVQSSIQPANEPTQWIIKVKWSYHVPAEPFNGADNEPLIDAINDCFRIHPKPHVHAMGNQHDLITRLCRHNRQLVEQARMWFYPLQSYGRDFVFLGFPLPGNGEKMPPELSHDLARALVAASACADKQELIKRVSVTETFVKEIGHDIASSVQATIAKLRAISAGRIIGENAKRKAKEVERDIWDSYRIAESLGIAVDSNYQLKLPEEFDLREAVQKAKAYFASEASERNIRFKLDFPDRAVITWGEKPAIVQAIGQLLSNAIKYSYGGNDVTISVTERKDDLVIRVTNRGIPLPMGPDLLKIWDFGFRGQNAKERHVNGSGIGLYSVKKIVTAHRGWVHSDAENEKTSFFVHFPRKEALQKEMGYKI
jgi:signal transduction histidine kinase